MRASGNPSERGAWLQSVSCCSPLLVQQQARDMMRETVLILLCVLVTVAGFVPAPSICRNARSAVSTPGEVQLWLVWMWRPACYCCYCWCRWRRISAGTIAVLRGDTNRYLSPRCCCFNHGVGLWYMISARLMSRARSKFLLQRLQQQLVACPWVAPRRQALTAVDLVMM